MGRTLDQYKKLLDPLQRVAEHVTAIPQQKSLQVPAVSYFRVVYFLEGELEARYSNGERFEIRKGDALLVGASIQASYKALDPEREAKIHILKIEIKEILDALPLTEAEDTALAADDFLARISPWMNGVRHLPDALKKFGSLELIKQIKIELDQKEYLSPWRISGLCLALIAPLFDSRHLKEQEADSLQVHRGEAAVEHARQYMQQYCHQTLNLGEIAWQVQLSGEHLGRLFRKYRGITVMSYLKQLRIEKARHLLETTSLSVVDIARRTGYSTPSLLCRHFKDSTGMTPLSYRQRAHKRENFFPSQFSGK
ncbi:helix-turn-helix domain-containing protein [Kiritimatiellaeota bacterium B1221]|nr:helix-turn-helix domain-containing protein [Kiritimatiellaeota bacterium B1221]